MQRWQIAVDEERARAKEREAAIMDDLRCTKIIHGEADYGAYSLPASARCCLDKGHDGRHRTGF